MSSRRWRNKVRHDYQPESSWDESAYFCRRCSQSEASWQHTTPEPLIPWFGWLFVAVLLAGVIFSCVGWYLGGA